MASIVIPAQDGAEGGGHSMMMTVDQARSFVALLRKAPDWARVAADNQVGLFSKPIGDGDRRERARASICRSGSSPTKQSKGSVRIEHVLWRRYKGLRVLASMAAQKICRAGRACARQGAGREPRGGAGGRRREEQAVRVMLSRRSEKAALGRLQSGRQRPMWEVPRQCRALFEPNYAQIEHNEIDGRGCHDPVGDTDERTGCKGDAERGRALWRHRASRAENIRRAVAARDRPPPISMTACAGTSRKSSARLRALHPCDQPHQEGARGLDSGA